MTVETMLQIVKQLQAENNPELNQPLIDFYMKKYAEIVSDAINKAFADQH